MDSMGGRIVAIVALIAASAGITLLGAGSGLIPMIAAWVEGQGAVCTSRAVRRPPWRLFPAPA